MPGDGRRSCYQERVYVDSEYYEVITRRYRDKAKPPAWYLTYLATEPAEGNGKSFIVAPRASSAWVGWRLEEVPRC